MTANAANFSNTTPSAPAGSQLVTFQNDASSPVNISAYVPTGFSVPAIGGFSWVNQGSSTVTQARGAGGPVLMSVPYNATLQWRYQVIAQPSTPYKVLMQSQIMTGDRGGGNQTGGICFSDGTKFFNFETLIQSAGYVLLTRQLTSFNQASGGTATNLNTQASNNAMTNIFSPVWFQLRNDGSTLSFDISYDGSNFVNLATSAVGAFLTPTQIGFGILAQNSSGAATSTDMYIFNWKTFANANLNN